MGHDSPEEAAFELAVINGHCYSTDADAALGDGPLGCDDAVEFLGILRRLGDKCTEGPRRLGDELVVGHRIVHDNGYPHVSLLELGHYWDDAIPSGLGKMPMPCADALAVFITVAYP